MSRERVLSAGAIGLILTLAAARRVRGLGPGLPHSTARPDEQKLVGRAVGMITTGDLNPVEHNYPALLRYAEAAVLLLYAQLVQRLGRYAGVRDFIANASATNRGLHYFICRALSVAFGVASVAATYVWPLVHVDPRRGPAFRVHMVDCAPGQVGTSDASYLSTSDHAPMPRFASVEPKLARYLDERARPLDIFGAFRAPLPGPTSTPGMRSSCHSPGCRRWTAAAPW
jgi:hypothetical protein